MGKYLIVEDNRDKLNSIRDELLNLGIGENDIEYVSSVNEATNLMRLSLYDMVILDLNLPMTKKGRPVENGGVSLLNKLKSNPTKYNLPKQIVGLTSFEYLKVKQSSDFEKLCFSLYDFELNDWKEVLKNKISWDTSSNMSKNRSAGKNIALSVHGIRTLGHWQSKLESSIGKDDRNFIVEKYKYNYFSAFQLLFPKYRKIVINKLSSEIKRLSEKYPDARFTLFSHSFGTYALIKALEELPLSCDLKIEKLFLVSSVLKSDYCFSDLTNRYSIGSIFNECGYNDNVLLLSHYTCVDMGMAGRSGFEGTDVINRFYRGGHDFFNRESGFIDEFWMPAINESKIEIIDERKFGFLRENIEIMLYTRHIPLLALFIMILSLLLTR